MKFIPDETEPRPQDVPYFDELRTADGWQGHATNKSYETLKSEVTSAMSQLDGTIHGFQRGMYEINGIDRPGVIIHYSIEDSDGKMAYGRLDIAAPPVKEPNISSFATTYQKKLRAKEDKSLRMALYNVVQIFKAQGILKKMNPSYVPLMPWLLTDDERTITERFAMAGMGNLALPAPSKDGDTLTGEFREVE